MWAVLLSLPLDGCFSLELNSELDSFWTCAVFFKVLLCWRFPRLISIGATTTLWRVKSVHETTTKKPKRRQVNAAYEEEYAQTARGKELRAAARARYKDQR